MEMKSIYQGIKNNLEKEVIPFWLERGIDSEKGGYFLNFDMNGNPISCEQKMLVTQTRMVWGFATLARAYDNKVYLEYAKQGVDFLIKHFWDEKNGGWNWITDNDGNFIDGAKLVYGQSFAIYALSEYYIASGEARALDYAIKTFDLLQVYAADTEFGGYFENLEPDWKLSEFGAAAGDIKSLNIHMHLLESFTTLYEASGLEIHRRKLLEVINFVLTNMADQEIGCGYDQLGPDLIRRPAISIPRTWTQDREESSEVAESNDTTFYGHNLELVWLLNRANDILGQEFHHYDKFTRNVTEHSMKYGFDHTLGGIYYAGPYEGAASNKEKEWWENCEALVALLDVYERLRDERYLEMLRKTWDFCDKHFINHEIGEWYQLVSEKGEIIDGTLGNDWKGIYHTARALLECVRRMEKLFNLD
ncbi:AGE family epimerase/isomerase [Lachnospiraceae bacterium OttesenSCG-928-E19]|nr:AGE family epimerase/isomerase [Lachnospiraceae bacterium OttesenSCG-928-E19]